MREKLVDQLDEIYSKLCRNGMEDTAEDILYSNNASEDDSSDAGFMSTMSNQDIKNAISEMQAAFSSMHPDSVQSMIYAINSGTLDASDEYCLGFIDACKMFVEEYEFDNIKGLED